MVGGEYEYKMNKGKERGENDGKWYMIRKIEEIKNENKDNSRVYDKNEDNENKDKRYSENVKVYEGYVKKMKEINKK